jgi:hypothetical protein
LADLLPEREGEMDDPLKRPVSRELEMLIPALADTMKYAVQAVRQSGALADVLIAKGLVTRAEFDEAMKPTANLSGKLLMILNDQIQKQS